MHEDCGLAPWKLRQHVSGVLRTACSGPDPLAVQLDQRDRRFVLVRDWPRRSCAVRRERCSSVIFFFFSFLVFYTCFKEDRQLEHRQNHVSLGLVSVDDSRGLAHLPFLLFAVCGCELGRWFFDRMVAHLVNGVFGLRFVEFYGLSKVRRVDGVNGDSSPITELMVCLGMGIFQDEMAIRCVPGGI